MDAGFAVLQVDKLVEENAFYATAIIPGGMYKGTDSDVQTFGVGATFVSSSKVADKVVYEVVKAVFENFGPLPGSIPFRTRELSVVL